MAPENTGNSSIIDNAKSGRFAATAEKSENASAAIEKNPDWTRLDHVLMHPATITPIDAANIQLDAAIFKLMIRRSRLTILTRILWARSTGGSGRAECLDMVFLSIFIIVAYIYARARDLGAKTKAKHPTGVAWRERHGVL
jgi:hypothetical protein